MELRIYSVGNAPVFAAFILLLMSCDESYQLCTDMDTNHLYEGRFFNETAINTTKGVTDAIAPHIFGCRHLCREMSACVGLTYSIAAAMEEFPCKLHNGTGLGNLLVSNGNSSTILFLEKHCGYNAIVDGGWTNWVDDPTCSSPCLRFSVRQKRSCTNPSPQCNGFACEGEEKQFRECNTGECIIDGGWTSWQDDPPCTSPCRRVVVNQTRSCTQPSPQMGGEICPGIDTRFRPCGAGECIDLSTFSAASQSDGFNYINISSRRVAVQFSQTYLMIQQRKDGTVDFFRNWQNYRDGFGDVDGEFWLGNEYIHQLTQIGVFHLRITLRRTGQSYSLVYDAFRLSNEDDEYRLHIGQRIGGDAPAAVGDSMSYHKDIQFSTFDSDNDGNPNKNCAESFKGGWWFKRCYDSHLNGEYDIEASLIGPGRGIIWETWPEGRYSPLAGSLMEIFIAPPSQ